MTRPRIRLLVADERGRFCEHPELSLAASSWDRALPAEQLGDPIPLPPGTQILFLPGRRPLGINPESFRTVLAGSKLSFAVAAIPPPGHVRLALPAYRTGPRAPNLPLRAYTAVGLRGDQLVIMAARLDSRTHWDPERFEAPDLGRRIQRLRAKFPANQVLRQLSRCATEYGCCTARNIFLGTFEGALPVAPRCNARCLGCISRQRRTGVPSPQERLPRAPVVSDIVEVAVHHLNQARPAMISFGQGCEGEPLTEADRIALAIARIRRRTPRGSIHLNTNGCSPRALENLARAGLDSIRVSLVSARPEAFRAYHRGRFGSARVEAFIRRGVELGLQVSLNLLVFPGFTDRPGEMAPLVTLLRRTGAQMVQLRNLDIDPEWFTKTVPPASGKPIGIRQFLTKLRTEMPSLDIGCFNRFREEKTMNHPIS